MQTPDAILDFWFKDAGPTHWFQASDAFDARVRREFEITAVDLAAGFSRGKPHPWEDAAESCLALIIALDQFSRNMYRGTRAAFAWDPLALGAAKRMTERNQDLKVNQSRRAFVYMPFMHSETADDQARCVALCDQRLEDASTLHHAKEHQKLITRFGRFPHRNEILGRQSTPQELQFLANKGYSP
jgi:uncharacterized protein (DUF924 family)